MVNLEGAHNRVFNAAFSQPQCLVKLIREEGSPPVSAYLSEFV
jgi:hypothetical protein